MATIITVHGTGATGAEEGEAWWQKGSPFEKHINELVESEDGILTFQPLIWDGANSEASRRGAAKKLLGRMRQLEKQGENYCVVGHSHGGSIISHSLLLASTQRRTLPYLGCWVTIGTPFIQFSKTPFLFSRIGILAKTAYVSFLTFALFAIITGVSHIPYSAIVQSLQFQLPAFLPFFAIYIGLWFADYVRFYPYQRFTSRHCNKHFSPRWRGFCHQQDEAVQGLRALKHLRINFIDRHFAVNPLSFVAIFIVPVLAIAFFNSEYMLTYAMKSFPSMGGISGRPVAAVGYDRTVRGLGHDFATNFSLFHSFLVARVESLRVPATQIVVAAAFPAAMFICSLVAMLAVVWLGKLVSYYSSRILDAITWKQIRVTAFGNDKIGEDSVDASSKPIWAANPVFFLPEVVSNEVSEATNSTAGASLEKLRNALNVLVLSPDREAKASFFSEYITWEELIHTSYFAARSFRILVAYSIANSEGFRPSAAFKSHPDYELVARWYAEIQPKPVVADERSAIRTLITNLEQGEQKKV